MDKNITFESGENEISEATSQALIHNKQSDKIRWYANITIVAYIALTCVPIIFMFFCQETFVSGIFLLFGDILFFLGALVFIHIIFRQARYAKKATIYSLVPTLLFYLLAVTVTLLEICFGDLFSRHGILIFSTVAISFGIISNIILFRNKNFEDRLLAIKFICLLVVSLTFLGPTSLSIGLPYIYIPRALNSYNLKTYNECIKFAKENDEYKNLSLQRGLVLNGQDIINNKVDVLFKQLYSIKCLQVTRDNDVLLFYKNANYILPVPPGVVYSLSGNNPNGVDSKFLDRAKPFVRIAGNWYLSKSLTLGGTRTATRISLPKSIIDLSLRIDGIDANELTKFD